MEYVPKISVDLYEPSSHKLIMKLKCFKSIASNMRTESGLKDKILTPII